MIDKIINNLNYISNEDRKKLKELSSNNIDVNDFFYKEFNKLMNEWHKEYPMFEIPSGIVTISINDNNIYLPFGNNKYTKDTIFDIASMTKAYTEIILFSVIDDYKLDLSTKIGDLVDFYKDIDYLTLMDLISFNNDYRTKIDIRECNNKKDAINALRTAYIMPEGVGYYKYTDLPIMILTDILESYTKMSYKELFNKYIKDKYDLKNTYLDINRDDYVTINKNMTNDPKANIMGGYYGHGGVKTTSEDFIKFFSKVLDSKYNKLFYTKSLTKKADGTIRENKALVGNMNLPVETIDSLASSYITNEGFAIQGSVRCHAETSNYYIDNKQYRVTISLFMDLYTQYDAMKEFERVTGEIYTKEYEVKGIGKLLMSDVRNVIKYTAHFKDLTNIIGVSEVLFLNNYLSKK